MTTTNMWEFFKMDFLVPHRLGNFAIERYEIPQRINSHDVNGRPTGYGHFTRLVEYGTDNGRGCTTWMSDTKAEIHEHYPLFGMVSECDDVLITGLGIGMAVAGCVKLGAGSITVVELDANVMNLVGPQLANFCERHGTPLRLIHEDARSWTPDEQYDIAWHDIWPHISDGNVPEMEAMRKHYSPFVIGKQECWAEEESRLMGTVIWKMQNNIPLTEQEYIWAARTVAGKNMEG